LHNYSRLVIDPNEPLEAADSIVVPTASNTALPAKPDAFRLPPRGQPVEELFASPTTVPHRR